MTWRISATAVCCSRASPSSTSRASIRACIGASEVCVVFFGEVRVPLFGAVGLAFFATVRLGFFAATGLAFFEEERAVFVKAVVALRGMFLRSLQAPRRRNPPVFFVVGRGTRQLEHTCSLTTAIDAAEGLSGLSNCRPSSGQS